MGFSAANSPSRASITTQTREEEINWKALKQTPMQEFGAVMLGLRVVFSIIGTVGNVVLILSIIQNPVRRLKTFEVFLLGLASANLELILIVDIYDAVMLSTSDIDKLTCRTLKFLTLFGEVTSIFFTVLISIYRCQKLRGANTRGNLPIFLDNINSAWATSGLCVIMSMLLVFPTYLIKLDVHILNITGESICPPDFYLCDRHSCPLVNRLYKYISLLICNLVPLLIITVSSCLIIKVLLGQRRVRATLAAGAPGQPSGKKENGIYRSTVAVLAGMAVFQVDWTMYLILHLYFCPADFPAWSEVEFFITTVYTTLSPYVYGIGYNFFSLKNLRKWRVFY